MKEDLPPDATAFARGSLDWIIGSRVVLPSSVIARYPELVRAHWRCGGLPLRIGGWLLGRRTVEGITMLRTVFLARRLPLDPELLLHELRHVDQFVSDRAFPLRYLWQALRHGYENNPYETDARAFAARRLAGATPTV